MASNPNSAKPEVVIRYVDMDALWYVCHAGSYQNAISSKANGKPTREEAVALAEQVGFKVVWHEQDQLRQPSSGQAAPVVKPARHIEVLPARQYYRNKAPGAVILVNGHVHLHLTGPKAASEARKIEQTLSEQVKVTLSWTQIRLIADYADFGIDEKKHWLSEAEPDGVDDPAAERAEIRDATEALKALLAAEAAQGTLASAAAQMSLSLPVKEYWLVADYADFGIDEKSAWLKDQPDGSVDRKAVRAELAQATAALKAFLKAGAGHPKFPSAGAAELTTSAEADRPRMRG